MGEGLKRVARQCGGISIKTKEGVAIHDENANLVCAFNVGDSVRRKREEKRGANSMGVIEEIMDKEGVWSALVKWKGSQRTTVALLNLRSAAE